MAVENETKRKRMEKPQNLKQKRKPEEKREKQKHKPEEKREKQKQKPEEKRQSKNEEKKTTQEAEAEAETKSSSQSEPKKNNPNKRPKQVFLFGNYKNYYGYRIGRDTEEDPRIKVLKKEWFEGKDCLDIGCNSGVITIQIAKKYNCKSILGLDIDSGLIEDAFWYLRKYTKMEFAEKKQAEDSCVKAVQENSSEQSTTALSNEGPKKSLSHHSSDERNLSDIVSFRRENFVQSRHPPDKCYDTILCLSVTKWIHLNWGDDGLITLFSKIWRLLQPGGVFVLEPQPWESYEKNRRVSETTATNYHNIMFRPERFQEILLDKIGFRKVEDLSSGLSGTRTGFDRPIFAFHK